jgi:hypothetical protein
MYALRLLLIALVSTVGVAFSMDDVGVQSTMIGSHIPLLLPRTASKTVNKPDLVLEPGA